MFRSIPPYIKDFSSCFSHAGFQLYLVGGAVRNIALGIKPKDWDFATDARPDEVKQLFPKVIPTGIEHGTVTVLYKNHNFEVTTFRIDGDYTDSRRPNSIAFTPSIEEDLKRRDFTMNAMAIEISSGKFLDPHKGRKDIEKKIIRTVGDGHTRFKEDALRIMRGLRFSCQYGFSLYPETLEAMSDLASSVSKVSVERFRDEFLRMLESDHPEYGIPLGVSLGVFQEWLPELNAAKGFIGENDSWDLLHHLIYTAKNLSSLDNPGLLIAGFFHDIAKPETYTKNSDGKIHFPGHDIRGSEMTNRILQRLKLPNRIIEESTHLIQHHMFESDIAGNPRAIRRLISKVGEKNILPLISLRKADCAAKSGHPTLCLDLAVTLEEQVIMVIAEQRSIFTIQDLAINGKTIMQSLSLPPGKLIGTLLEELLELVLDDPQLNIEETLISRVKDIYEQKWKIFMTE